MAELRSNTFPGDADGQELLRKVKKALTNLTGLAHPGDGRYPVAPKKLNIGRDVLKPTYKATWAACNIEYDPNERGASIKQGKDIRIGPFFLQRRFTVMDIEKVILHEYLHAVIAISMKEAHHGHIDQIIQFNLRYPGAPNPAEGGI